LKIDSDKLVNSQVATALTYIKYTVDNKQKLLQVKGNNTQQDISETMSSFF
jgi:hypothetical protein